MEKINNKISEQKLKKYFKLTEKALKEAKKNISNEKEAKEIVEMVENYLSDAKYFQDKKDLVNAFAALNYAHGWLDCGARLKIFDVSNSNLFTIA